MVARLTPREREVLALLAEGKTNGEISAALGLATETVRTYLNTAYGSLGLAGDGQGSQTKRVLAAVIWTKEASKEG